MDFKSNAECIRYFSRKLLDDGNEHTVVEIKDYVKNHSNKGDEFTEAMFSGAIRAMVNASGGQYVIVKRGVYKKVQEKSQPLLNTQEEFAQSENSTNTIELYRAELIKIIDDAISAVKTISVGNFFDLSDEKVAALRGMGKLLFDMLAETKHSISAV